jgi:hypothetical protein
MLPLHCPSSFFFVLPRLLEKLRAPQIYFPNGLSLVIWRQRHAHGTQGAPSVIFPPVASRDTLGSCHTPVRGAPRLSRSGPSALGNDG